MINWLKEWWETFRVWRESDAETWAALTNRGPIDPDEFVEVDRPR